MATNMPLLTELGPFLFALFYKHAAPMALTAPSINAKQIPDPSMESFGQNF
jgi:hypothetical protein